MRLLERHECRIVGRVWVKQLDVPIDGMALHVSSLRFICAAFHAGLADDERGMVLTDSQTYQHNHRLAHAIFTQRFARRPSHERLLDMPVFGHSDNHAGLQLADLLCHPWRDPREGRERFSLAIHDPLKRSTQRMWGAAKPSYDVI
ncbi:MAG TPA: DUF3800 domain-containing protein [Conexibacter sp.]|nr:DUF3800 domain-containing protein [Conexibacter sp.]